FSNMAKKFFNPEKFRLLLLTGVLLLSALQLYAQNGKTNSVAPPLAVPDTSKTNLLMPVMIKDTGKNGALSLTLKQCIDYALKHQPGLNISLINIDVAKTTNAINLSGALPQASASGDLIHYLQQSSGNNSSTVNTGTTGSTTNTSTRQGYTNTFIPGVAITQ